MLQYSTMRVDPVLFKFANMKCSSVLFAFGLFSFSSNLKSQGLTVPNGETFYISSGTTVKLSSGTTTVSSGGTLTVNGEFQTAGDMTVNGTLNASSGSLTYNGSAAQSVSLNGATVKDVNIGSSASVTLSSGMNIQAGTNHGTLTVSSGGTLTTGGNLTLKSDANGSAVIAEGSGSGSYISGNVIVERYIPAQRAYRLLSPSVTTTGSIRANWQENGGTTSGLGTHISGSGGATNGFDATGTNNPSLFTYNVTTATGSWSAVTNTNSNTLSAGIPYRLMVRGDRSVDLTDNAATATNTVLRATGTVGQGNKTITGLNTNANGFTFIGNPFPCAIDMGLVMNAASNINTGSYTVWDPNVGTRGAYVTVNLSTNTNPSGSNQDKYLQSGQACFIQTASSGTPALSINESAKAGSSTQTDVFRSLPPFSTLHLTLFQTDSLENKGRALDGLEINFDPDFDSGFDSKDARKVINSDENLSVFVGDQFCSIDSRNIPELNEKVDVRISQMRHKNYTIIARFYSDLGMLSYLHDKHTNQFHILNSDGVTRIDFDNDGSNSATANQRFALVFEKTTGRSKIGANANLLFPNPVNQLSKKLHSVESFDTWKVYDVSGRFIASGTSEQGNTLSLPATLSPGMYLFTVSTKGEDFSQYITIQ